MKNNITTGNGIEGTRTKRLVPELRFPEFENEWETDMMQSIFDMKNGYTPSKSNPTYWDNGTIPWFRMEDIRKNGHILSDSIQHVTQQAVKKSGLFPAYSIIVATTATIGEHALIIVDSLANQRFTFLTKRKSFEDKIDMMYFHHYMFIIDEWCKKNTNHGGLISVNMPAFKHLLIPFPSPAEQQKIAGCLSSIDEEISALKEKVEQLKAHKKGLMQKLFPITEKFVPELRFPEFKKDREWKEQKLEDVARTYSGGTPSVNNKEYYNGDIPFIRSGEINKDITELFLTHWGVEKSSTKIIKEGTILYALYGATSGEVAISKIGGAINQAILAIIPDTEYSSLYIYQYLKNEKKNIINSYLQGGQGNLSGTIINNLCIPFPSPAEQQKIAECLSSVDELISLYENKVTLQEQHKKGLMQQLFPKL